MLRGIVPIVTTSIEATLTIIVTTSSETKLAGIWKENFFARRGKLNLITRVKKTTDREIVFNPIFNALIQLLEIPRRNYAVSANEPIPTFDIKFDLVTGFHTYFNGHRTENVWTSKEWDFFLKTITINLLIFFSLVVFASVYIICFLKWNMIG